MNIEEIHRICKKYEIVNYTINDDMSIDVDGGVFLSHKGLNDLPLKFRNVTGHFDCSSNNLTTLDGVPNEVGRSFSCSNNELTSLEGAPSSVDGFFDCEYNNLTSLEYVPSKVGDYFDCSQNNLTSLEGAPSPVGGYFHCHSNPLESLKGIPLNLSINKLYLPDHLSYSDYITYCNSYKRDLKFKKILKCQ